MMERVLCCVVISRMLFHMNVNDPAWSFVFSEKEGNCNFILYSESEICAKGRGSLATDFRRVKMAPDLSKFFMCSIPEFYLCIFKNF